MEVLRTPDERFIDLPGYAFEPHYVTVDGLRMHYLDEPPTGPSGTGGPVLMLHGEPSWSYLYRKVIPVVSGAGYRVIAPDLIGFGRSDKPISRQDYTYARHVGWLTGLIETLDLQDITLVAQDWGGLLGLRLVGELPGRFGRIVAANTFLPTGDQPPSEAFLRWREFSQSGDTIQVGRIVKGGCATPLSEEVIAAYDAPFPDERYKAGARQFPLLVPTSPDDPASSANRQAWEVLHKWEKPFLTAFSDQDAVTRGGDRYFQAHIPGAKGQRHTTITGAGHFLQEDKGAELGQVIVDFLAVSSAV